MMMLEGRGGGVSVLTASMSAGPTHDDASGEGRGGGGGVSVLTASMSAGPPHDDAGGEGRGGGGGCLS